MIDLNKYRDLPKPKFKVFKPKALPKCPKCKVDLVKRNRPCPNCGYEKLINFNIKDQSEIWKSMGSCECGMPLTSKDINRLLMIVCPSCGEERKYVKAGDTIKCGLISL